MPSPRDHAHRAVDELTDLGHRSVVRVADRLSRIRVSAPVAVQAGVAAGIAWFVAHDLVGHARPFFAPIAAVIVLGVSVGQRLRRAIELVLGVALGIGVGDILIFFIGTGGWQIALVVVLAILAAVFVGGSATLIGQCASSAVLVATLAPPTTGIYYSRFVDALVGGLVGLVVMALLLPVNPLTTVQRAVRPALDLLTRQLIASADALSAHDIDQAHTALDEMRAGEAELTRFREALGIASETASIAPTRWRSRAPLAQYLDASVHIDRALRNARVLARRTVSVLDDDETYSPELIDSVRAIAGTVQTLRRELGGAHDPKDAQQQALAAVRKAADAYRGGLGFSGDVVVAQVRAIATDLLRATGIDDQTSARAVRLAVGRLTT
ncbi:MAG TPA: FUSC family protein [Micromonosporaceae bacterium]